MFVGVSTALTAVRRVFHPFVREGLKLYYRFTETFSETQPDFLLDGSTFFDGSDYIQLASDGRTDFANQSFTISAWIKPDAVSADRVIFSYDHTAHTDPHYAMHLRTMSSGRVTLNYNDGSGTADSITSGNNAITAGVWQHVCTTYTSGTQKIYVNGSLVASGTDAHTITFYDQEVWIGKGNFGGEFEGSMANVGIWDRALSASEVESIQWRGSYSELKDTELTNLVSWYDLDSTSLGSDSLTNGTFENWASASDANNWGEYTESTSTVARSTDSYAGTYAMSFVINASNSSVGIYQSGAVTAGKRYKVSFYAKSDSGTPTLGVRTAPNAGNGVSSNTIHESHTLSTTYTQYTTTFDTPAGDGNLILFRTSGASKTMFIDNVVLEEVLVPDSKGSNNGSIIGATVNTDSYSGESPFKPRIQDIATPKMAVQLADGSTSFDGTNDYISIADADNLSFGDGTTDSAFSLSAWVKIPNGTDTIPIFHKYSSSKLEYRFINHSSGLIFNTFDQSSSGYIGRQYGTAITAYNNQWIHLVGTYSGNGANSGFKIYLNGSQVDDTNFGAGSYTAMENLSENLEIGRDNGSTYGEFSIANVAIHSSELTQTQVQELMFTERYQNLSSDLKTNLVSWYDLGSVELGTSLITGDSSNMDTVGSWNVGNWSSGVNVSVTSVSGGQEGNALQLNSDSGRGFARYNSTSGLTVVNGRSYRVGIWVKNGTTTGTLKLGNAHAGNQYVDQSVASASGSANTFDIQTSDTDLHFTVLQDSGGGTVLFDNVTVKPINVADSHGSNTGEVYGATTTTGYTSSPHGVVDPLNFGEVYSGRALDFDGSNDLVVVPDSSELSFGDGNDDSPQSISAWIYMDDASEFVIINKGTYHTGEYNFHVSSSDYLFFDHYDEAGGGTGYSSVRTDAITAYEGQWIHVCGTYNGAGGGSASAGKKIYINGVSQSLTNADGGSYDSMANKTDDIQIGRYSNAPNAEGKMASLKMFSAELTQDQVRELYTKPETVLPTGLSASNLKLDLPMQEGAGSYVHDGSGNQNHGTITGATWVTGQEYGYQASLVRSNTPMHFDGSNDLVQISSNLSSNWTFSTWARADFTDSNWHELYDKNPSGGGGRITIAIVQNKFQMYDTAYRDSGWTLSDKNWHHYVITQTGTALKFYVDGSYQATVTGNGNSLGGDAHIGRYYPLAIEYWSGIINEMALYDTALDADAITALYNSGVPLLPTSDSGNYDNSDSLVGYWRNDGITTWTDRTPSGTYGNEVMINGDMEADSSWSTSSSASTNERSTEQVYAGTYSRKFVPTSTSDGIQSATLTTTVSKYNVSFWVYLTNGTELYYAIRRGDAGGWATEVDATGLTTNAWNYLTTTYTDTTGGSSGYMRITSGPTTSGNFYIDQVSIKKYRGGNNGTATNADTSIVIPEGSTSGRDSQGFLLSDTTLTSNNGLRMYGGGEVIKLDDSELFHLGTKDFTFEFWAKFNETSTTRGFFNYFKDTNNRFHLSNYSNIDFWANVGGSDQSTQISNTRDLDWHHYVVTKESNTMKIYIDTSVVKTNTSWTQDINFTGGTFYIGVRTDDGSDLTSYNVDGSIDEFRIYHKALSSSEVTKNYNNGKSAHQ